MNPISRKRSLRFGDFISHAYDIFFHTNRDYHEGTDADHIPVIPGSDFAPDVDLGDEGHRNESSESNEATS